MATFTLYASNVAGAAGLNRYKTRETVLEDMGLKKPDYNPYENITEEETQALCKAANISVNDAPAGTDGALSVLHAQLAVQKLCKEAVTSSGTTKESKKKEKDVVQLIQDVCQRPMDKEWIQAVKDNVRYEVNTQKGCMVEQKLTDKLEEITGRKVTQRNKTTYSMALPFEGYGIVIRGRVDGLQKDKDTGETVVVETKSRRNRLFSIIPLYEKVQMEVYMRMVDCQKAVLNQHLQYEKVAADTPDPLSTLSYQRDDALWSQVLEGLKVYGQMAMDLTSSTQPVKRQRAKDLIAKSDDPVHCSNKRTKTE